MSAADRAKPNSIRDWLRLLCRIAGQCVLLWLLFEAGSFVAQVSRLPLPGNLVGLLLLLLLLETGFVRATALTECAGFVSRHLGLFFVPYIVGIMVWSSLIATSGVVLGISLIGSAVVGILTAAICAQRVAQGQS